MVKCVYFELDCEGVILICQGKGSVVVESLEFGFQIKQCEFDFLFECVVCLVVEMGDLVESVIFCLCVVMFFLELVIVEDEVEFDELNQEKIV